MYQLLLKNRFSFITTLRKLKILKETHPENYPITYEEFKDVLENTQGRPIILYHITRIHGRDNRSNKK